MSLQTPRTRTWSKSAAVISERIAKRKLQLCRTLSQNNYLIPQRETMEVAKTNVSSDQGFTSQETEDLGESNIYDEEAFAEALNDINSELESLRSLYNSQWFTDMRKSSYKNKNLKQLAHVDNIVTTEQLPGKTPSNDELSILKYRHNTALIQKRQSALKKEANGLNRGQKILPPLPENEYEDDIEFHNKIVEIPANVASSADAPVGVVYHTSNKPANVMGGTQNLFSDNKQLYNNFTQMLCEVDKITNELADVERFKDALYAMNAEAEKYSRKKINTQETNRKVSDLKMPRSQSAKVYSPLSIELFGAPEDKQLDTALLNRRAKGKNDTIKSLQSTKQKSLNHSFLDKKRRNHQVNSENSLPLEVNPLQVSISVPRVSRHNATNNMAIKSSPKASKHIVLK